MVEGLTSSATDQGSVAGDPGITSLTTRRIEDLRRPRVRATTSRCRNVQTQTIPVTPAERPHPFPSRTRKLSSPAPKILRGQPFGKIGRRRDFCVSRGHHPTDRPRAAGRAPSAMLRSMTDDGRAPEGPDAAASPDGRPRRHDRATDPQHLPVPAVGRRRLAERRARPASIAARRSRRRRRSAAEKQRRLCLTAEHATCATYLAAGEAARRRTPARPTRRRPVARTTPVVLDQGRLAVAIPAIRSTPGAGQAAADRPARRSRSLAVLLARLATGGGGPSGAVDRRSARAHRRRPPRRRAAATATPEATSEPDGDRRRPTAAPSPDPRADRGEAHADRPPAPPGPPTRSRGATR